MRKIHKLMTPKDSIKPVLRKIKVTQDNEYFLTDAYKGMIIYKDKCAELNIDGISMVEEDEHYPDLYAVLPKDDEYERQINIDVNKLHDLLSAIKELKKLNKGTNKYNKITLYIPKLDNKPIKIVDDYQTSIIMPLNK